MRARSWLSACVAALMFIPLARAGWREDADARIEKIRKGDFTITLTDPSGKPVASAVVIRQIRSQFGFGTCVRGNPYATDEDTRRYIKYILDHYSIIVCENAMKWLTSEPQPGQFITDEADLWCKWAKENDMPLRGHCLFWEKAKWNQPWIVEMPPDQLRKKVDEHIEKTVSHFRGRLVAWDVDNEILNGEFFAEKLGADIRPHFFKQAARFDPDVRLFTNEYSILGMPERVEEYVKLIKRLQAAGAPVHGIGVQDHGLQRFALTDAPATRPARRFRSGPPLPPPQTPGDIVKSFDRLGELGLPIHLTEISSITPYEQGKADTYEMFYRVAFSHPAVEALLIWGFWERGRFKGIDAAIVTDDWKELPAGKVLSRLLTQEWRTNLDATPDGAGKVAFRGFYGTYEVTAKDAAGQALRATVKLHPGAVSAAAQLR